MKNSIRRIGSTLGILGLLAFSFVSIHQISKVCADGQASCMSAAVTFGVLQNSTAPQVDMDMRLAAPTTIDAADSVPTMLGFILTIVQVLSVYLILLSVIVLVVLELIELRYLRKLVGKKTA